MSSEKKPQSPPSDLPPPTVNKAAAEKVKGGAEPINDRLKPAAPINDGRTR